MGNAKERIGDDLILERMYAAEQTLLSQADGLDMKASYLLVILVFLAQLSATFLANPKLTRLAQFSQCLCCLLLFAAGVMLLLELRVHRFKTEDAANLETWRDRVVSESEKNPEYLAASDGSDYLRSRLVWGLIEASKPRILQGEKNNKKKVKYLRFAYWLTAIAFLADVLSIFLLYRFYGGL